MPAPPHSPRACLDRHPHIQPQISAGGSKRVPTARCPHRTLLAHGNNQISDFRTFALCVSLYTVACTHTHTGGVCVSSRCPCRSSALCNPRGWCLRQCLYGEHSAGSIFKAVLGSQHAPAFHSTETSTPVSGPGNAPLLWEVCASSGRPDGSSRSSCGMG